MKLDLFLLPDLYAVCRLDASAPIPPWLPDTGLCSLTRFDRELSIVCVEAAVPPAVQAQRGMRVLAVRGPLDFALVGVLASLAQPLAAAGVSVFTLSTYDTDYLLVRADQLASAQAALRAAGHATGKT